MEYTYHVYVLECQKKWRLALKFEKGSWNLIGSGELQAVLFSTPIGSEAFPLILRVCASPHVLAFLNGRNAIKWNKTLYLLFWSS